MKIVKNTLSALLLGSLIAASLAHAAEARGFSSSRSYRAPAHVYRAPATRHVTVNQYNHNSGSSPMLWGLLGYMWGSSSAQSTQQVAPAAVEAAPAECGWGEWITSFGGCK